MSSKKEIQINNWKRIQKIKSKESVKTKETEKIITTTNSNKTEERRKLK